MRLSELVSSLGLWIFPVVGLIGFFSAFVFVALRVARHGRGEMAAFGRLPLEERSDRDGSGQAGSDRGANGAGS